jgi:hypothetical protein
MNEKTTIVDMNGKILRDFFPRHKHLLIWGEGGSGKTALACQIALWAMADKEELRLCKHKMLPVLLEEDLPAEPKPDEATFLEALRGQLQSVLDDPIPISTFLFTHLLATQRILVLVDHFSEMNEETRQAIRPESPDFGVKALIVTSRANEPLGHLTKTTIQPMRIEGDRISSFLHHYFLSQGKRDLFDDSEFFMHCQQLTLIAGDENITPLLVRLYADQVLQAKEKSARAISTIGAKNIPDLMLSYINTLNRDIHENRLDDRKVHWIAKCTAWQCVKMNYEPSSASREKVLETFKLENADHYLDYLEHRLHLIHTIGPAEDHVRFALDPIAEYLAGLYLAEEIEGDSPGCTTFFGAHASIPSSFLRVLLECCEALTIDKEKIRCVDHHYQTANTAEQAATPAS